MTWLVAQVSHAEPLNMLTCSRATEGRESTVGRNAGLTETGREGTKVVSLSSRLPRVKEQDPICSNRQTPELGRERADRRGCCRVVGAALCWANITDLR